MRTAFLIPAALTLVAGCSAPADLLIVDARVIDGSGTPARGADVLIDGGRIVAVGQIEPGEVRARRVIDARGRVLCPGFIDTHAHGDPLVTPAFENALAMGVTTIVLGQDGSSPEREDLGGWLEEVAAARPGPNIATLVGHGTVRQLAGGGYRRHLDEETLGRMAALVAKALEAGAFGLSTGLEYDAGKPADHRELVAVARPLGRCAGLVMSHLRSEDDDRIEAAMEELFAQCRAAGAAAHIAHIKVVHGRGAGRAEEILTLMERARAGGLAVSADIYPYTASYTGIGILYPDWARPPNEFAQVVKERRGELAAYLRRRVAGRGGPGATLLGSGPFAGKTLAEVAEQQARPFEEVLIDEFPPGSVSAAYFVMDAELMRRLLLDPHVMICSDGSPTIRHPRGHGTFARVLREFVRERGLLTLEEAVRKMSSLPARTLGLSDRGLIAPGEIADLLLFDPAAVRDLATYTEPHRLAAGFDLVIVHGVIVREDGEFTGRRGGEVLRRGE